mgnify:CR=1 FL=1
MFAHRSHRQVEMTAGPLLPNVLAFTVPLILSGVLQLLYNSADIIVVGRFADSVAMASVGATTSLIQLLVSMLMGLSVGASVAVARATGAGDRDGVRCAVHTSMALAVLSGVLLGAQLMCEHATDMIGQLSQAIANGMTARQLLAAMRPHPTFEEALGEALEELVAKLPE